MIIDFGVAPQWNVVNSLTQGETLDRIQRLTQRHHELYVARGHAIERREVAHSPKEDPWVQEVINVEAALEILWVRRRAEIRG